MNDTITLPQSAVEEDHRLEAGTEKASERLAKHRWHWTLDESNPERVPIKTYARQVGRSQRAIQRYVHGYDAWQGTTEPSSLVEAIERAGVGVEQEAAIEAIAEARGQTFAHVRRNRPDEVRALRHVARDVAERKGTNVTDEVKPLAQSIVKGEERDRRAEVASKERHGFRYHEVSKNLLSALFAVRKALEATTDVPFDTEERELLADDIRKVREVLTLIDSRLSGTTVLDWDAELTKIMEGVK